MLKENFVETIGASLREFWDVPCFNDLDKPAITYGDLAHRMRRLHYLFEESGLEKGDRVAVIGRNSANWGVIYLAAVTYGAVIVPILPDFACQEAEHILRHSKTSLLFVTENIHDTLNEEKIPSVRGIFDLRDLSLRWTNEDKVSAAAEAAERSYLEKYGASLNRTDLRFDPVGNDELAAIVYTSGTTGFSKGVMLAHNALMANVRFFNDSVDLAAGDRIVSFLPLAHAFGCAFDFLAPLLQGCQVTFVSKLPTPKVLLKAFAEIRPAVVMAVPLIIEKIYRAHIKPALETPRVQFMLKVPGLKKVVYKKIREQVYTKFGGAYKEMVIGGAALNREIEAFFREVGVNLTCGYGMTECGPLISYSGHAQQGPVGSVGRIIPYLECRIDKPDPETGVGEVLVRGENRMLGYYADPEATAATIDADGWLHTGDLGKLDRDGYLFLTGRSKNMILTPSGQNVYPEEIESQLNNLPCVEESLILEHDGQLHALVYPDVESVDRACLQGKQVETMMEENRQKLNSKLPNFAQISRLKVLYTEFEKTPTKKIKRRLYNAFS